jgi:hypothetical protein
MKVPSQDGTYTDYIGEKFGVRVRAGTCRPLALEGNAWKEFDKEYSLPVPALSLEGHANRVDSMPPLASCVWWYEAQKGDIGEDLTELRMRLIP